MQNRYVGDVGDFGKYGLLKALCQSNADEMPSLSLGIVWYLFPDEEVKGDGKFIKYLIKPTKKDLKCFRGCDPPLYDALAEIVSSGKRNVKSIREHKILPAGTVFYEKPLTFSGMPGIGPSARELRIAHRKDWVQGALRLTSGCDIVFLDPDNGLQSDNIECYHKRSPKYVFFDELSPFWQRGQSLVIYQHMDHSKPADRQIKEWLFKLNHHLGAGNSNFALRYHRGTARAFLIVPTKTHEKTILNRTERLLEGPWSEHFTLIAE